MLQAHPGVTKSMTNLKRFCGWAIKCAHLDVPHSILILTNQAAGHGGHNILTGIMNEKGVELNGALDWLAEYSGRLLSKFQAQYRALPSWGPETDSIVASFVEKLGLWNSRVRLLGVRGGEILWDEETRSTEAQIGDSTPKVEQTRCDANDGSTHCLTNYYQNMEDQHATLLIVM
ncbi:hypothetical protein EI94DRAFT_1870999 [Lactarius quietus]|nr:hypothetical protein EI94DRAFT_1870999 [Lactarius quietus]